MNQRKNDITLQDILNKIKQSDETVLSQVSFAILERYQVLFPDWRTAYIAFPKNDPKEKELVRNSVLRMFDEK